MKKSLPWATPKIAGVIVEGISPRTIRRAARDGADIVEVRVDTFKDRDMAGLMDSFRGLRAILRGKKTRVLLTVRKKSEGGGYFISDAERREIFNKLVPLADIIDVELSSSGALENVVSSAHKRGKTVIISYHNFSSTPALKALEGIVKKGLSAGADIVKIASKARDRGDMKNLAGLLSCSSGNLIVIAMGRYGAASRVFFPMLGSLITYGSVTRASAPGQIPVSALREAFLDYRVGGRPGPPKT